METYYQRNRDKILARVKAYQRGHVEIVRVCRKKNYEKSRDKRQTYYRDWYEKNGRFRSDSDREITLEWRQANPEKVKIQNQLRFAVRSGEMVRPTNCAKCGRKAKIDAHHFDYDHYSHVIWLCASCHKREHNNFFLTVAQKGV
jgi:hypothetical protein